jgi:hypothetical protein
VSLIFSLVAVGCCFAPTAPVVSALLSSPSRQNLSGQSVQHPQAATRSSSGHNNRLHVTTPSSWPATSNGRTTAVMRSSFLDDIFKFFDPSNDSDSNDKKKNDKGSSSLGGWESDESDGDDDELDDSMPAGTTRIVSIPVQSIKPGGLRLFLMFYLLGMQNTPDKGTWSANQPSTDEYVLEFWFRDRTAVLTMTLESNQILLDRTGSSPSVAYLMQETSVVQGILDELQQMASDDQVDVKDRLLLLAQPDSIQRARDSLAFS